MQYVVQFIFLCRWRRHRLSGNHSLGEAAFVDSFETGFANESVVLGIANQVGSDLRRASVEWVGTDEDPRVTKGGTEGLVEATLHDPPTASSNCNEWWQDSLEHDSCGEFVVTGASDYLGKATISLGIVGLVAEAAALQYVIKLGEGAAGKSPFIYVTKHARFGSQCGPFGDELLDHGRLARGMTD